MTMASPIKILSWNIQIFGFTKMYKNNPANPFVPIPSEIFKYIAWYVTTYSTPADIIAIMEINEGAGSLILGLLIAELNNFSGTSVWKGQCAERQVGSKAESYIILWQDVPKRVALFNDPITLKTFYLSGRISTMLLGETFLPLPYDPLIAHTFVSKLENKKGGVSKLFAGPNNTYKWVLLANKWKEIESLQASGGIISDILNNTVLPNAVDQKKLQDICYKQMPILFPDAKERFPYIAKFNVDPNDGGAYKQLTAIVYHAPFESADPVICINNLGQLKELNDVTVNRLVMGDFNVPVNSTNTSLAYGFVPNKDGKFNYEAIYGAAKQYLTAFVPLTGAPVSMPPVLTPTSPPLTSLAATYFDPATTPSPTAAQYMSSAYDNLLFGAGSAGALSVTGGSYDDLIVAMTPPALSATTMGALAMQILMEGNGYSNAQKQGNSTKPSTSPATATSNANLLACLAAMNCGATNNRPSNLAEAQVVYRYAISDHIPVWVELS